MQLNTNNKNGDIFVSNGVVAEIAGAVASRCYGVVGMAAKNPADDIFRLLKQEKAARGVSVVTDEDGVKIHMHVIVEYGININTVCKSIVRRVRYALEQKSGIAVSKIYVRVEGVRCDG